jgi:elongation factor Ts
MADISASMVKELREKTGAGMMDCKKALGESSGDLESAVDWLRKKGLAAAAKKAGRVAAEGLIGFAVDGKMGALVEVNSETDFVARNDTFQSYVSTVAKLALGAADVEALRNAAYPGEGKTATEMLTSLVATIGENMSIRRSATLTVSSGVVASYMHSALTPDLGKIGVLVGLESTGDAEQLRAFGRQVAMHIAAANPQSLDIKSVDPKSLDREREVLKEQARVSGKAEAIIDKMVEGRLRKFYEEVVLLEQVFVIDGESRVKDAVAALAKQLGTAVTVTGFVRFALGEGIQKEQSDFAAEVAAQAGL